MLLMFESVEQEMIHRLWIILIIRDYCSWLLGVVTALRGFDIAVEASYSGLVIAVSESALAAPNY